MHQDDLERRLNNWSRWYWSGGRVGMRGSGVVSSIYHQGPRGRRAGVAMPVIDGEAIDTHDAVDRLPQDLRDVLRARYLRIGQRGRSLTGMIDRQVARALRCDESTFYRRLRTAKHMLADLLAWRRRGTARPSLTPVRTAK